jgi:hypothetical protein
VRFDETQARHRIRSEADSSGAPVREHPARASIGVHPGDARSKPASSELTKEPTLTSRFTAYQGRLSRLGGDPPGTPSSQAQPSRRDHLSPRSTRPGAGSLRELVERGLDLGREQVKGRSPRVQFDRRRHHVGDQRRADAKTGEGLVDSAATEQSAGTGSGAFLALSCAGSSSAGRRRSVNPAELPPRSRERRVATPPVGSA